MTNIAYLFGVHLRRIKSVCLAASCSQTVALLRQAQYVIVDDLGDSVPELPEVETIRRHLEKSINGKVIEKAEVHCPRLWREGGFSSAAKKLKGKKISAIRRRGKYMLFDLGGLTLISHLGMTGQFVFSAAPPGKAKNKFTQMPSGLQIPADDFTADEHTHLVLRFEDKTNLFYRDPRTFGFFKITEDFTAEKRIARLGIEPLEADYSRRAIASSKRKSSKNIKTLLLDQSFIAGIGNIYADEALFAAGILPQTSACELSEKKWQKLCRCIQEVLTKGLENFGTSFSDYRKPDGSKGANQERLKVYGREALPCVRCKNPLEKAVLGGRTSVYCGHCQG